uniref:Uncharacterized protein n=1 Tax=Arundo donax TaxID=35708 RepID=A0A0A8Y4Q2_ARUDO
MLAKPGPWHRSGGRESAHCRSRGRASPPHVSWLAFAGARAERRSDGDREEEHAEAYVVPGRLSGGAWLWPSSRGWPRLRLGEERGCAAPRIPPQPCVVAEECSKGHMVAICGTCAWSVRGCRRCW